MTLDVRPRYQKRLQTLVPTPIPPDELKARTEALRP